MSRRAWAMASGALILLLLPVLFLCWSPAKSSTSEPFEAHPLPPVPSHPVEPERAAAKKETSLTRSESRRDDAIHVRVLDESGNAVNGASLAFRPDAEAARAAFAKTDTGGDAWLASSAAKGGTLQVRHSDFRARRIRLQIGSDVAVHLVRLDKGASLQGRVIDLAGVGVGGASVTLRPEPISRGEPELVSSVITTTDRGGRFRFIGLHPREYRLRARVAGYAMWPPATRIVQVRSQTTVGPIVVHPWVAFSLLVKDKLTGQELALPEDAIAVIEADAANLEVGLAALKPRWFALSEGQTLAVSRRRLWVLLVRRFFGGVTSSMNADVLIRHRSFAFPIRMGVQLQSINGTGSVRSVTAMMNPHEGYVRCVVRLRGTSRKRTLIVTDETGGSHRPQVYRSPFTDSGSSVLCYVKRGRNAVSLGWDAFSVRSTVHVDVQGNLDAVNIRPPVGAEIRIGPCNAVTGELVQSFTVVSLRGLSERNRNVRISWATAVGRPYVLRDYPTGEYAIVLHANDREWRGHFVAVAGKMVPVAPDM